MPIKPENKRLYPPDWPAISLAARERARWRCQHPGCRATQYSVGTWRAWGGGPLEWQPVRCNLPLATARDCEFYHAAQGRRADGSLWTYKEARAFIERWCWPEGEVPIVIVLTVAHLNHDPADCQPDNLRAMCQRHHLAYDQALHRINAWATRRAKAGTLEMF